MVSLAAPEDTDMIVYASTQNANKTQKFVAAALNVPANRVSFLGSNRVLTIRLS
jgi:xanthine dehydrogenase molybdopterin-binding subunit B